MTVKVQKRIEANRIIGFIRFRDHFNTWPAKHSKDLCGHPVYYWKFLAVSKSKYMEKLIVYTENKEAQKLARRMSDKFVIIDRPLCDCLDQEWIIADDLKTAQSRVPMRPESINYWSPHQDEVITKALGFEPTLKVSLSAACPLERTESLDRLIERYFEDDLAEWACMIYPVGQAGWIIDPRNPNYIVSVLGTHGRGRRQEDPILYQRSGSSIESYRWTGMRRLVYIIIPQEETTEIHDDRDLELAKFYMEKRLKEEGGEKQ